MLAHECSLDQVGLIEAEPNEGARRARILRKADATMRQKQSRIDPLNGVFDQSCEFAALLFRNGGAEILNLDQSLADENDLGDFVDSCHP